MVKDNTPIRSQALRAGPNGYELRIVSIADYQRDGSQRVGNDEATIVTGTILDVMHQMSRWEDHAKSCCRLNLYRGGMWVDQFNIDATINRTKNGVDLGDYDLAPVLRAAVDVALLFSTSSWPEAIHEVARDVVRSAVLVSEADAVDELQLNGWAKVGPLGHWKDFTDHGRGAAPTLLLALARLRVSDLPFCESFDVTMVS